MRFIPDRKLICPKHGGGKPRNTLGIFISYFFPPFFEGVGDGAVGGGRIGNVIVRFSFVYNLEKKGEGDGRRCSNI